MAQVLINGQIYTNQAFEQAMVIDKETISFVGSTDEALRYDPKAEVIDLQNAVVVPGWNDSHMHLFGSAFTSEQLALQGIKSIKELLTLLKDTINANGRSMTMLVARGFNQNEFAEKRFPTKKELNQVSTTIPIILTRVCGHIVVCNSIALAQSNISPTTTIFGGEIDFETGKLTEKALDLLFTNRQKLTKDEVKRLLKKSLKKALSYGITTIQTDDLMHAFPNDYERMIEVFQELDQEGELTSRLVLQSQLPRVELLKDYIQKGYPNRKYSDYLKMGPLKILIDGTLGARTAAMRKPYADDPTTMGVLTYSKVELLEIVELAHQANMMVAIHAIGDLAMTQVLDVMEEVLVKYPKKDHRHTIIHCQITSPDILERMKKLDVFASVQPIFIDADMVIVYDRVGDLANTSYAFNTMMQLGINVAIGTDAPVEDMNPYANLRATMTRCNEQGQCYLEEERMSLYDAIDSYTINGAKQARMEQQIGRLLPGFFADFVILSGDEANTIYQMKAKTVYVGGKAYHV